LEFLLLTCWLLAMLCTVALAFLSLFMNGWQVWAPKEERG